MKQLSSGSGEIIRFDRVRRVRGLPIAILIVVLTAVLTVIFVSGRGDGSYGESETSYYETQTESESKGEKSTECEVTTDSANTEEATTGELSENTDIRTAYESETTDALYETKDLHGEGIVNSIGLKKTGYPPDYDFGADASAVERCLPVVLIIHTHTSEAYSEAGGRSEDNRLNVTSVGEAFAERLSRNGICAIHCTVPFDSQTTMGAYSRAAEVIENYLRTYPEITYIVDIHRMSDTIKTLTDSGGAAQVRFTVSNSSCVIGEERNLAAALKICEMINRTSEICTPIFEGEGGYNHDIAVGYRKYMLTVEIGAVGNTLEEAKRAAVCTADALSKMIFGFG